MTRRQWHEAIEGGFSGSGRARAFAYALVTLIVLSTLAVVLETDAGFYARWSLELDGFDRISIAVFTIEYGLRIWVAPEHPEHQGRTALVARLRYLVSPMALVDLIAIAPAYVGLFVSVDLRYMRLFRLLRLLKLTHYFHGLAIFLAVAQAQARALLAAVFTISMLVIIAATLMYALEHQAQPQAFGNIGQSVWWAIVTMTTVGYGDVTPITTAGRMLAAVIMLLGVGIVALPAGMLAARFSEELQTRREEVLARLDHAIQDGRLDATERSEIERLSRDLGVPQDMLDRMLRVRLSQGAIGANCPHCGKSLR
jgi:voltage-gated potassium channel